MTALKIKSCPFCGSVENQPGVITIYNRKDKNGEILPDLLKRFVRCVGCFAEGPEKIEWNDAKDAWNKREES